MSMGFWQLLVILVVVLIVFGAGRLPKVMGDLGKGIRHFKDGLNGTTPQEHDEPFVAPKVKDDTTDKKSQD